MLSRMPPPTAASRRKPDSPGSDPDRALPDAPLTLPDLRGMLKEPALPGARLPGKDAEGWMDFAWVSTGSMERGHLDRLMAAVAARLVEQGRRVAGVVRADFYASAGRGAAATDDPCGWSLAVLPEVEEIAIQQDLGKGSTACKLDAGALEDAAGMLAARLDRPLDILILNKFGPVEAEGRGFRPVIAQALERGLPVLVGLPHAQKEAFEAFSGGLATGLEAELPAVLDWCLRVTGG